MNNETILLAHGGGGRLSNELINSVFVRHFANANLNELGDAAVFDAPGKRLCFSTDSFVVSPLEFPGGNIGSLAVHGTAGLTAYDLAALRFLFAGAVMLPFFIRLGPLSCAGLGWKRGLALALTGFLSATIGGSDRRKAVVRVTLGGAIAMAVTYGIGTLTGHAIG